MLNNIKWIPVELSQEEEDERIEKIANMLQRFMEENSKRGKSLKSHVLKKEDFKKTIRL